MLGCLGHMPRTQCHRLTLAAQQLPRGSSLRCTMFLLHCFNVLLQVLATLTTLQLLVVVVSSKVTDLGILGLTKLTGLEHLSVVGLSVSNPLTLEGTLDISRFGGMRVRAHT